MLDKKYSESDLKAAFRQGFEKGRKVLFFNGKKDLDERSEKAFREWLVEHAR